jgi:hypothetical protein
MLSRLERNLASFVVELNGEEEPEEFAMIDRNGIFRPHWPTLPNGYPDAVDPKKGYEGYEIGQNRRRGILPASRIHHHDDALRGSQGMAKPPTWNGRDPPSGR